MTTFGSMRFPTSGRGRRARLRLGLALAGVLAFASAARADNECWSAFDLGVDSNCVLSLTDTWDVSIPTSPFGPITCEVQLVQAVDLLPAGPSPVTSSPVSVTGACPPILGAVALTGSTSLDIFFQGSATFSGTIVSLPATVSLDVTTAFVESTNTPTGGYGLGPQAGIADLGIYGSYPLTMTRRCRNGMLDAGEQCDSGGCCDTGICQFRPTGAICRYRQGNGGSLHFDCDSAETCAGGTASCPADTVKPAGASCDDLDNCTTGTECTAGGACVGEPVVCAPCTACIDNSGCVDLGPWGSCYATTESLKATLAIKSPPADPAKAQVLFKLTKGQGPFAGLEVGDPIDTVDYELCVYQGSTLVFGSRAPHGGTCAGKPCWKAIGDKGFKYSDPELTPDGASKLQIKGGVGTAKALFKGKGAQVAANLNVSPPYGFADPLRAQVRPRLDHLVFGSGGTCLEAEFSAAGVVKNDAQTFKGKGD